MTKVPVIYKIETPSNDIYIGQTKNLRERLRGHKNNKKDSEIHYSILKYGIEAHKVSILCVMPKDVSKEVLDTYEDFYIKRHKECGFSMLNIRGGGARGKHAVSTKNKIGAKHIGNSYSSIRKVLNLLTEEEKWENALIKEEIKVHRKNEFKAKARQRMIGNTINKGRPTHVKNEILQYNLSGEFVKEWVTIAEITRQLGISKGNIHKCLNGEYKQANGYTWVYKKNKI